jgi:hypothetical protein
MEKEKDAPPEKEKKEETSKIQVAWLLGVSNCYCLFRSFKLG